VIELTRAMLTELRLIEAGARPRINIALTRGASLSADAYLDAERFVHIKASELEPLEVEYRAALAAWQRFGAFVPRPLAFAARDGWDIIITEGVRFEALTLTHFAARSAVPAALREFFACSVRQEAAWESGATHLALLDALQADPLTAEWARVVVSRLDKSALAALGQLPRVPQHGDLTRNNVGVTAAQGIVVFDWEDFGAAALPGLDLCTLLLSLAEFEEPTLRDWFSPGQSSAGRVGAFVTTACEALGLEPAVFRDLLPLYVLVFLKLKAGYSERLRQSLTRLLQELIPDAVVRVA